MRYTRQQLKQDKLAERRRRPSIGQSRTAKTIISGAIALACWWPPALAFSGNRDYRQAGAAQKFGDALVTYNAPVLPDASQGNQMVSFASVADRALAAKKQFYAISAEYGSARAGRWATTLRLWCEVGPWQLRRGRGATERRCQVRDVEVSSLAKLALASVYRNQKKDPDAVAVYKDLIDHRHSACPRLPRNSAWPISTRRPIRAEAGNSRANRKDDAKGPAGQIAAQHQKAPAQ